MLSVRGQIHDEDCTLSDECPGVAELVQES